MDLDTVEKKILAFSPFVKEVKVTLENGLPHAAVYPDFQALKSAHIVNIEAQIRWYAIELYNMEVDKEEEKIRRYTLSKTPLFKKEPASAQKDIKDELYKTLRAFIATLSDVPISPSSHLELDLGLDSLNYVELFVFVEQSFGVHINEEIFSSIMVMKDFYAYVKEHQKNSNPTQIDWMHLLSETIDEKLIYSPWIIFTYKTLLFPFFKLYFRLEISGKENIPKSSCIIAPTHQSMLDGFLIESSLPYSILKNTFFLAFEAVFGTKYLRPVSKHGQTLLIDANNNLLRSMRRSALPLKEGKNLVIFPEGARTRDRKLLEFRPFFAMLSKTYNVPIVPTLIDGSFEALQAGKLFPRPAKIKIRYLEPIYPENLSWQTINQRVREAIENDIKKNSSLQ